MEITVLHTWNALQNVKLCLCIVIYGQTYNFLIALLMYDYIKVNFISKVFLFFLSYF